MTTSKTRALTLCALLATTCLAAPALAQEFTPAERQAHDQNGVDLISGKLGTPQAAVGIGPEGGGLSFVSGWAGGAYYDSFKLELTLAANLACVKMADRKSCFTEANGVFTSREGDGATLTATSAGWLYVGRDGSEVRFFTAHGDGGTPAAVAARGASVTLPDGEVVSYHYRNENGLVRVQSVTSSRGYQLKATYVSDDPAHSGFRKLAKVTAINNAVDYCGPAANACTGLTQDWPELVVAETAGSRTYTDRTGAKQAYGLATGEVVTARAPGDVVLFTVAYDTAKRVKTFSRGGGNWQYRYLDGTDGQKVTRVTDPLGRQRDYLWDPTTRRILSVTDELEHVTRFDYDATGRLVRTTAPEGNKVELTYDARGNVTERRAKPKAGSGQTDIVITAAFPAACTNPKSCNKPTSTTDARGFTTNYIYSAAHGSVLTATAPAPAAGAVRPQVRYSYTALRAQVKNSNGGLVLETPIYRLTATSTCQTLAGQTGSAPAACADPNLPADHADEVKTVIAYDTTGDTNNLLATSVSTGAGDGSLTATSSLEYDAFGRLAMTDGPLAGTTDAIRYRYDAAGRLIGTIYPDPDGAAGPLKRRAQKIFYGFNDLSRIVSSGTVEGLSDADWANFATLEYSSTGLDAYGRVVGQSVSGGGGTASSVRYRYDVMGRVECAAVRMSNAASYTCEPAAAGADGPDRVTYYAYTARGEVARVTTGYGTVEARQVASYAYSANGLLRTQLDGENNRTSFGHDGHDRLVSTRFARQEKNRGQTASNDVEELSYDAGSNVVARKLRDNDDTDPANDPVIGYVYDNLGRLTLKDLPGTEPDTSYGYDNLGRMLTASQQPGHALTFTYDALGRNVTQAGPLGTIVFGHDIGGRRTRLRWSDGFFVTYDHLVTGEMTSITEYENNDDTSPFVLATFGYDDLGRRTSIARGNGTTTSYGYDGVSRLASLSQDLSGTGADLALGFQYNKAGQITELTRSRDLYAFTAPTYGGTLYETGGLNQLTKVGAAVPTHDGRGNLTSDGTKSYSYSTENLLVAGPNGATLSYDPAMRLYQTNATGVSSRKFAYDGADLIAEYDGNNVLTRRHVHGPGVDEPLVTYEGSDTATRRWLHADERGSIVASSNVNGAVIAINKYDEYGVPGSGNEGRFQYTGQAWLPELGLYYYKARMYDPKLGQFLQSDPIGFGQNFYAYAGCDPVNRRDPWGLSEEPIIVTARYRYDPPTNVAFLMLMNEVIGELDRALSGQREGGEKTPKCPTEATRFKSREAAGVGAVQASRAAQRAGADRLERSFSIQPLTNGEFVFRFKHVGTEENVQIEAASITSVGAGHTHTFGGGNELSESRDAGSFSFFRGDVEKMGDLLDQHTNPNNFMTILGGENGKVYAWYGRNLKGQGREIGSDKCE